MILSALLCLILSTACQTKKINAVPTCKVVGLSQDQMDKSAGKGYKVTCRNLSLTKIPSALPGLNNTKLYQPLRFLDLGKNDLTVLGNDSFTGVLNLQTELLMWLTLDFNEIKFIDVHAFYNLTGLIYLNLSNNALIWPSSYALGLFKPLYKLQTLNLNGNAFNNFENLGQELKVLNRSLRNLYLDAKENCRFGLGFEQLILLTNVSLSNPSGKTECNLTTIKNDTFQHIPQVNMIWVSNCRVRYIERGAFSWFKKLKLLDLSYNEDLGFLGMNDALYGLKNSSSLEILNVNHVYPFLEAGITLNSSHLENLQTLQKLETLHMDLNKIEVMDPEVLENASFPESLRNLTLSGNRLTAGKYIDHLFRLKNIHLIDISRQHLNYDPYFHEHFGLNQNLKSQSVQSVRFPKSCSINVPPNVTKFLWHDSFLYTDLGEINICGAENLEYLDLHFNLITGLKGPIKGLENLKFLDLSQNVVEFISDTFFVGFRNLQKLNISTNILGPCFDPNLNNKSHLLLQNLGQLRFLDMSSGQITTLHEKTFSSLVHLKELRLTNNMLNEWSFDLSNIRCLNFLDLSGNKLDTIPPPAMEYLDSLTSELCNRNRNVTLNISMNSVICSCHDLPFLKWVKDTQVSVYFRENDGCRLNGKRYVLKTENDFQNLLHILETQECADHRWIHIMVAAGCTFAGMIVTGLTFMIVYKKRWKLRYLYYRRNRRYQHTGYERLFAYDAMISYTKSRAQFVKDNLYPAMNNQEITLWIADKDSQPGVSVAENITHAICNSRKAVLLVDSDYMKDSWCDYEMNMAIVESVEAKRKMIIVVLMETPDMTKLPIPIMRVLQSERSLEYPEHTHDVETFWTNLANEISS